ncbi:RQC-minor-1 family DNA-binding protein [Oceanobacillus jeddahense]|uniref:RQC-minor-1 family DNA-binding protein n=1 Tax=Oceanobacillus jeddahense TaxID=1462527 RepID=UPI000595B50B|nr:RQC-minor-1 family DNA-binding protein [Oceanobacillus jeddahense]
MVDNKLSEEEILAILRAADELIAQGGRSLLAKILKGSREKKVLQLGLDACPAYGYFKGVKLEEVMEKIDWMIDHDFLDIEYSGKLPMIVFTERGWHIERDKYADEFLHEWDDWLAEGKPAPDMTYLKDRNRNMIFLFLEKMRETQDKRYIPYLEAWKQVDYRKVRERINSVIRSLETEETPDYQAIQERESSLKEALKGDEPQDLYVKCWECGDRFLFSVGEQQFYRKMGFHDPKRCPECRMERDMDNFLDF